MCIEHLCSIEQILSNFNPLRYSIPLLWPKPSKHRKLGRDITNNDNKYTNKFRIQGVLLFLLKNHMPEFYDPLRPGKPLNLHCSINTSFDRQQMSLIKISMFGIWGDGIYFYSTLDTGFCPVFFRNGIHYILLSDSWSLEKRVKNCLWKASRVARQI